MTNQTAVGYTSPVAPNTPTATESTVADNVCFSKPKKKQKPVMLRCSFRIPTFYMYDDIKSSHTNLAASGPKTFEEALASPDAKL